MSNEPSDEGARRTAVVGKLDYPGALTWKERWRWSTGRGDERVVMGAYLAVIALSLVVVVLNRFGVVATYAGVLHADEVAWGWMVAGLLVGNWGLVLSGSAKRSENAAWTIRNRWWIAFVINCVSTSTLFIVGLSCLFRVNVSEALVASSSASLAAACVWSSVGLSAHVRRAYRQSARVLGVSALACALASAMVSLDGVVNSLLHAS